MTPQNVFDKTVIHQTYLERRSKGILRDVLVLLRDAENDIKAQIVTTNLTKYQAQRLDSLLKSVQKRIDVMTKAISVTLKPDLEALAKYEAGNQAAMLKSTLAFDPMPSIVVPPNAVLVASVVERPILGKYFDDWMSEFDAATVARLNQSIRMGVLEGEPLNKIIKRVRKDIDTTSRAAERLVRTSVNSVTNNARQLMWAQNSDIIKKWQFVATLDSRTSLECAKLDGKIFDVGEGQRPPRHPNCRSTTVPVVDGSMFTPTSRASMGGQVDADLKYPTWLKTQPASVQKEVLGDARYNLWKEGRVEISQFTDKTGRTLSLDELVKKDKG